MRVLGIRHVLVLCAVSVGCSPAVFAQSATYNFTGAVTSTEGSYTTIANGALVTGTITYDPAAAASGSVATGGVMGSSSPSEPFVFSETASVGTVSFSSYVPAPVATASGISYTSSGYSQANETGTDSNGDTSAYLSLVPLSGDSVYTSNGLLNPGDISYSAFNTYGQFNTNTDLLSEAGGVTFSISNITPVPLPASGVLLLLGTIFLGYRLFRHREQTLPEFAL